MPTTQFWCKFVDFGLRRAFQRIDILVLWYTFFNVSRMRNGQMWSSKGPASWRNHASDRFIKRSHNKSHPSPTFQERVSSFGFQVSGFGFRVPGFRFRVLGLRVSGFDFQFSGFGFRVSVFGLRVSGFGFRFSVFGFRFMGFGFRVSGFGLKGSTSRRTRRTTRGRRAWPWALTGACRLRPGTFTSR